MDYFGITFHIQVTPAVFNVSVFRFFGISPPNVYLIILYEIVRDNCLDQSINLLENERLSLLQKGPGLFMDR